MALEDDRFRLLIAQYCDDHEIDIEAHGAQSRIARAFGNVHPSTINKILGTGRGAGEEVRDKVCDALNLDRDFFKVPELGDRKRYTDWQVAPGARRPPPTFHETTLDRDGDPRARSPYPDFERYIGDYELEKTADGRAFAQHLRGIYFARGAAEATYAYAGALHLAFRATHAGKAIEPRGERRAPKQGGPKAPPKKRKS
jgi:hypothetical protein